MSNEERIIQWIKILYGTIALSLLAYIAYKL